MPNLEVKRCNADGSVGFPHVRVGHRRVLIILLICLIKQINEINFFGSDSAVGPPNPMPNLEVKRCNADGSVGLPHVRVGHCQIPFLAEW